MGISCSRKQHFAACSTTEAKQKSLKQNINLQNAYISVIEQLTKLKWMM